MSKMDTWFRKHDPRRDKRTLINAGQPISGERGFALSKEDGYPLVVLRPKPEHVEEIFSKIDKLMGKSHAEAKSPFDAILRDYPHQFIGYVSGTGAILNSDGVEIEPHMQRGDSVSSGPLFAPPGAMRGAA